MLPLVAIDPIAMEPEGTEPPATGDKPFVGGNLPRVGGNPSEWAGAAVFRGPRLAGKLNVVESRMLLALRGQVGKTYMSVPDPVDAEEIITFRLHQENKPQYRIRQAGGRLTANIRLHFDVELVSWSGRTDFSVPAQRRKLEDHIATYLLRTHLQPLVRKLYGDWGTDPVGLGIIFRRRFVSYPAWEQYDWHSRLRQLEVGVDATVFIRRFGMILDQTRPQPQD